MKKLISKKWLKNFLVIFGCMFISEIIFRIISKFSLLNYAMFRILFFDIILSLIFSFILSFVKGKLQKIIIGVIVFLLSFYAFLQLGFNNFLGVYISLGASSQLGAVVDYVREFFLSFKFIYYLCFIPFLLGLIFSIFFDRKKEDDFKSIKLRNRFLIFGCLLLFLSFIYFGTLKFKFMQSKMQLVSNVDLFRSPNPPSIAINQLGVYSFGIMDLKNHIFPASLNSNYNYMETEKVVDYTRNIDDTAFNDIITNEKNDTYNNLNKYYINQNITSKNDYTGYFKDKNLIVIMMESANDILINKDLYPNFYKLYSEGWHWENNYSPRNSCATGNNELSGMTGLYSIYNSCTANYYKNNTYFTSIFNLFNRANYTTFSMHDYTEAYYARRNIHTNLGSMKYYSVQDLKMDYQNEYVNWASDAEFMEKFIETINNEYKDKTFMTWLTTVSSHQPYSVPSILGEKHLDLLKDYDYPRDLKRYMSKLKELDNGLGILIDGLKKSGKLDDTVIVLFGDHYPYGLSKETINKVLDYDLEDYEVERVPFVIYNSKLESNTFDDYTSYVNIVPTIANLFDLEFDPRYYMGTDLFSDVYNSLVVFADGSWKNEKAYYNAATGNVTNYDEEKPYTTEEIMNITSNVKTKIDISTNSIKKNYFNYLEKKFDEYNKSHSDENLTNE